MVHAIFALTAGEMSWGERASTAGIVTLQGMLTVFLVLAILWGIIEIMHYLLHRKENKDELHGQSDPSSHVTASGSDDAAIAAAIAAALAASEDDGATVAAITAAISAAMAEEGYHGNFRVVSFKRVGRAGSQKRF